MLGSTAVIAIWGIISQRSIARRRATLDHIVRSQGDGDLIGARQTFISLAKEPGGLAIWAEADREKSRETQSIALVLNEFELLAIGMQRGIIDFELYRRFNRSGVIHYWNHAAPFVHALRARVDNQMIYHEFEELKRWMEDSAPPKRNHWIGRWF